jgi:glycosyltransferase involved in cell wall biosynthesis
VNISCCLITLNEESNLARCLASCAGLADEIVVVDSGSADRTEAIARGAGARWLHQDWLGFVAQKNLAITQASHSWVLSLDADEELSPELRAELGALRAATAEPDCAGFSMPRCVCYEGRWIRHGDWYPDRLVRLFRRDRARFAGERVHERLELDGPVRALSGELRHYSFKDAADHRARIGQYARLWAESRAEGGGGAGPLAPCAHAAFRWLRGYVLRRGFLDGRQGWRIAAFCAQETFLKYRMLRALSRR